MIMLQMTSAAQEYYEANKASIDRGVVMINEYYDTHIDSERPANEYILIKEILFHKNCITDKGVLSMAPQFGCIVDLGAENKEKE